MNCLSKRTFKCKGNKKQWKHQRFSTLIELNRLRKGNSRPTQKKQKQFFVTLVEKNQNRQNSDLCCYALRAIVLSYRSCPA